MDGPVLKPGQLLSNFILFTAHVPDRPCLRATLRNLLNIRSWAQIPHGIFIQTSFRYTNLRPWKVWKDQMGGTLHHVTLANLRLAPRWAGRSMTYA